MENLHIIQDSLSSARAQLAERFAAGDADAIRSAVQWEASHCIYGFVPGTLRERAERREEVMRRWVASVTKLRTVFGTVPGSPSEVAIAEVQAHLERQFPPESALPTRKVLDFGDLPDLLDSIHDHWGADVLRTQEVEEETARYSAFHESGVGVLRRARATAFRALELQRGKDASEAQRLAAEVRDLVPAVAEETAAAVPFGNNGDLLRLVAERNRTGGRLYAVRACEQCPAR